MGPNPGHRRIGGGQRIREDRGRETADYTMEHSVSLGDDGFNILLV